MRTAMSVVAAMLTLAGPVVAQTPRGPVPVRAGLVAASGELRTANSATLELRRQVAADSVRQTQWVKGGVIGGLMLGAAMGYFFYSFQKIDDFPDTTAPLIGGFVIGGALGFVIGALIGGQFEK